MKPIFKFRFVNEITGSFVLLALLALIAGVFLAGRAQGLFESKFHLYARFDTDEGSFGLKRGAEIRIRDTLAGSLIRLEPDEDGNIEATFEIKESFHNLVREGSKGVVRKTLIVTGDSYIEILPGNPQNPLLPNNSYIECGKDAEIMEQALTFLEELRSNTIPNLVKLQATLDLLPSLIQQTSNTLFAAETLLQNDTPQLMQQAADTLSSADKLLKEDLAALTKQTQATLQETQATLEGLQRHWILRKYMPPSEADLLLQP